ncbi:Ion transport protein-domain-containing protein [Amylostereum chailletii]|nr:Ion transport protein-domain-containing protein [Amylostereum chailletii]
MQAGASMASLISSRRDSNTSTLNDMGQDDDETHLTANMSQQPAGDTGWPADVDAERISGATPRTRRRTLRYSATPSPMNRTGSTLRNVSKSLRRVSLRVVNLAGKGLDDHIRMSDSNDLMVENEKEGPVQDEDEDIKGDALPDLRKSLPIRGKALGILGPENRLRLAMFRFLVYPWTEPAIFCLIIFNAVVLIIQASHTSTLPDEDSRPPLVRGYFHTWEDYALFTLFVIFSLEAFSRICVSGFLIDPEIPVSSIFTSPFAPLDSSSLVASSTTLHRQASTASAHAQAAIGRKPTITHRLRHLYSNVKRPFGLAHTSSLPSRSSTMNSSDTASASATTDSLPHLGRIRSDTMKSNPPIVEKAYSGADRMHGHLRDPSRGAFPANAMRSNHAEQLSLPFRMSVSVAHGVTHRNVPYLRHSWSRIDFIAIVGFWTSFILAQTGVEHGSHHIGVFRALSVLRTARLLTITSGTTTILRSLKIAGPLLANVALFVIFAMSIFSIIGIQAFNGSFRRSCYLQPTLGENEIQLDDQTCGGYIDPVFLNVTSYIDRNGRPGGAPKGYICPLGQEADNPESGLESFDTIYLSVLQVFITSSANGWSPLMYSMIDAEYFVSCFFFIVCLVVINFWLLNLFVAVITNTFSAIRGETHKSAFGAAPVQAATDENDEGWAVVDGRRVAKPNRIRKLYESIRWCWVALALLSLVLQATFGVDLDPTHREVLDKSELILTILFDAEILIRIAGHFPDWRSFMHKGNNWLDTVLAIGSTIILIPAVHNSRAYPWLTVFELMRFYRVILEIPRMKPLLLSVFGNMYGLSNMTLFLVMINFIVALFAIQLLRGDIAGDQAMNFGQVFTSFLAIYQVFSSENWTNILYNTGTAEVPLGQSAVVTLFFIAWFFLANFIVLQMFIAVINENFDVAEEAKRGQQADSYFASQQPTKGGAAWMRKFNPYRWIKASPKAIVVENLSHSLVLPMQKALVQDYGLPSSSGSLRRSQKSNGKQRGLTHLTTKSLNALQQLFIGDTHSNDVPLANIRAAPRKDSTVPHDPADAETERHLELLAAINSEATAVEDTSDALYERRAQKADFIRNHPTYDKTFWIFSQKNSIRRLCQTVVRPAGGDRIFGRQPSPPAHTIFQFILLLTVIGGIITEVIATPIYRRNYYMEHGLIRGSWFDIAESIFGFLLVIEFIIKIIADGFSFTPNAYIRSIWNILDCLIMIGLLVNVTTGLIFIGGLSRFTRALKGLRALRLITLIEKMRSTFENLIISGVSRIFDAAVLAILYMIPYAVWGLTIFAGLTNTCNDDSASGVVDCVNEFTTTVIGDSFAFPTPRVWDNPSPSTKFSFDSFRSSLLILFEIVSLEGWTDVMNVATSITGRGLQPQTNVSQINALFFLIYNLLGAVVILTLFVSIIIGNFSSKTGSALLTQAQREWIDLQKLITRQRPSKRPKTRPRWRIRSWCFDRAVSKHGWWSRSMTVLFTLHVVALMTQTFYKNSILDQVRNDFFLFVTVVYAIDIIVRFYGLGYHSFRSNGWNIFDVIVASGSLFTTISVRVGASGNAIEQLEKLFLVSIAFKLVQRMNNLNKLFKTAVASLPVIVSLLSLWVVLFLFFAILFVEVFSLTKWHSAETRNQNYSTVGKSMVMLAFMTSGEGWNQYMHDYATVYPRCTVPSATDPDSDCGSVGWSFSLFIAWNLLSMYIFVNLFTGVVVENFSYVFQMTGGAKAVTREEMRAFKKVWAEYANPRTGFLERNHFSAFFSKLSGIFEVRIYPKKFHYRQILAECTETEDSHSWNPNAKVAYGLNLQRLNATLNQIDYGAIRRRRNMYSRLHHEVIITHEQGKGISFTNMLMLLAHHKLIVDADALVLRDLLVRTQTNDLVTDLVNLDRVRSILRAISDRRRFLKQVAQSVSPAQDGDLPAIIVDGLPSTPPRSTRDITSHRHSLSMSPFSDFDGQERYDTDVSLGTSPTRTRGLQRNRRTSDVSVSSDLGLRYTRDLSPFRDTTFVEDGQDVLATMQKSSWGAMMLEAEEEEEQKA